jgi:hypothetical protein
MIAGMAATRSVSNASRYAGFRMSPQIHWS